MADHRDDRSGKDRPAVSLDDRSTAVVSAEAAQARLVQAEQDLSSLRLTLERLVQVSESSRPLSDRLSDLALDAAREVLKAGGGARASLPALTQLMEMRHQTVSAFRHLESYARQAAVIVQNAVDQVKLASGAMERVLPPLREGAAAPSEKVVALELKLVGSGDKDNDRERKDRDRKGRDRKDGEERTIFDVWPEARRSSDLGDN